MQTNVPKLTGMAAGLYGEISALPVVDCHEHLPPEAWRTGRPVDAFTLFSHYTGGDLLTAGMAAGDYQKLLDTDRPLSKRWALLAPLWPYIQTGSYARAALLAAERFYGISEITGETIGPLTNAMQEANTPGLYRRVLRDACGISVSLVQRTKAAAEPLFAPVVEQPFFNHFFKDDFTWRALQHPAFAPEAEVTSLEQYEALALAFMEESKQNGAVAFKTLVRKTGEPCRKKAEEAFRQLKTGQEDRLPPDNPLTDYLHDRYYAKAAELDLPVSVHTGYWGDFRRLDPLHLIPVLLRHPDTRFDVFHLGYPWARETMMLGKLYPNVWLNLCWTHIISQTFAQNALCELFELVPHNKIFAFGGDYGPPVEKVYGHLMIARENLALALGSAVDAGRITVSQALFSAKAVLFDNPNRFYNLRLSG